MRGNGISRCFRLAAGSFVYCRAEAFRDTGGFPQDCYTGEEIWFSRKLKAWGRKGHAIQGAIQAPAHDLSAKGVPLLKR